LLPLLLLPLLLAGYPPLPGSLPLLLLLLLLLRCLVASLLDSLHC
jgi:hypothetical protein